MLVKLNKKYPAIKAILNKINITAINFSKQFPNSFIKFLLIIYSYYAKMLVKLNKK